MSIFETIKAYFVELDKLAAGAVPELDASICKTMNLERMSLATRAANAEANPTAENLDAVAEGFGAVQAIVEGVKNATGEDSGTFSALNIAAHNALFSVKSARRNVARSFARSQIAAARANAVRA